ncbi:hypothetical protein [Microbacterium sp.]|uniref:hypothetical protein n=1 Tax=Microbacterium sp. TaxID=51671 RepID=UPI0039E44339
MDHAADAVLEILTWVGLGGAVLLGVVAVAMWAADGTWLPADAIIDREGDAPTARWFDADGDANSAVLNAAQAETLAGKDTASLWYRHGWRGRIRLARRAPGLRAATSMAAGLLLLAVVAQAISWVLYFARG